MDVMINNWSQIKVSVPDISKLNMYRWATMGAFIIGMLFVPNESYAQEQESSQPDTTQQVRIGDIEGAQGKTSVFSEKNNLKDFINFGDYSVQDVLRRMPGVQVSRDGNVNIRGVGYQKYGVSVNGLRLAPTGMGSRDIALDALSADGLQSVELIKVVDPSMSADALAGVIEINSENMVSEGDQRAISAMVGGGANTKYLSMSGPGSRGWVKYAERFSDKLSLSVNLNYHEVFDSKEELQLGFGSQDFGNGFVDVYDRVSPGVAIDGHGRFSSSVNVDFTPSSTSSYSFNAFFNTDQSNSTAYRDSWVTGGDWIDQSTTGADGEAGSFSHEANLRSNQVSQLAFSGLGENEFDAFTLSYQAGWSQGSRESDYYTFPFQIEGLNYALDLSTEFRPQMEITNSETQVLDDGTVDRQFMIGQNFHRTLQDHINNQLSARVDVEFPIEAGALKAGVSSRLTFQDAEYGQDEFEYNRTLRMISFNMLREPNRNIDVINDNYRIPWFLNTEHAKAFLETQRPLFTADDNYHAYQSEVRNHGTEEQIYGTYAMADLNFGGLEVKAGARIEYELYETQGNEVTFDEQGDLSGINEVTASENRFYLFPNLQLGYELLEGSRLDLAYSSTVDRPDFFTQTPFLRVHNQDSTTFSGNAQIGAATADNVDLKFTQQLSSSGVISVAGFYKSINDMIVQREFSVNDYDQTQFVNSDETATVYGAEVSVDQALDFLPGLFSDLSLYANYTWSQSNYQTFESRGEMPLTGQSPHVVNAALNYTIPRFTAQVSYHWSDDLLTDIAETQQRAPSLGQGMRYLDRYENGYQELSATASYELSDRFMVWGNARHMINSERSSYLESLSAYPVSTYFNAGFDLRVGVRFDL
ncbi:MAG: hypothetical protein CL666_03645 [Balneola sp.]|nr:hypothetical protein [Balneola sp.]|tara:strand:- start:16918 stop:19530 length:2613 start_codon:yes stop_codon:yes gene_type:complete